MAAGVGNSAQVDTGNPRVGPGRQAGSLEGTLLTADTVRGGRANLRWGAPAAALAALLLVGIGHFVLGVVELGRIHEPPLQVALTPLTQDLHLRPGRYEIYQVIGSISSDGTQMHYAEPWVTPADVTVTDGKGNGVIVRPSSLPMGFPAPYVPGPRQQQGTLFAAVAEFRVRQGGSFRVVVHPQNPARVMVASPLDLSAPRVFRWRAVVIIGVIEVVTTLATSLWLALQARRARTQRRLARGRAGERLPVLATAPAHIGEPAAPPQGWYPDPWAPGFQRFWDGEAWTGRIR